MTRQRTSGPAVGAARARSGRIGQTSRPTVLENAVTVQRTMSCRPGFGEKALAGMRPSCSWRVFQYAPRLARPAVGAWDCARPSIRVLVVIGLSASHGARQGGRITHARQPAITAKDPIRQHFLPPLDLGVIRRWGRSGVAAVCRAFSRRLRRLTVGRRIGSFGFRILRV